MYKLSVGAIIKNESTYILEWIAYHLLVGVEHFYIADNCSDDGQYQLLEALNELGIITLIHQGNLEKSSAQVAAYNKIIQMSVDKSKLIAFIDGDEFIAINDLKKFNKELDVLISDDQYGAMALNWKTFGSSGKAKYEDKLVIERFLQCGNDQYRGNWTIKTISKPTFVERQLIHHAVLKKGQYKHVSLDKISFENGKNEGPRTTDFDYNVAQVNHYVIKSKEEFVLKKMNRGCANRGKDKVKFLQYFDNHDVNDECCYLANSLVDEVSQKIKEITNELDHLGYFSNFDFKFDRAENNEFSGWVKYKDKMESAKLRVLIDDSEEFFFNADMHRPKLFELSGGIFGKYGFNFKLPRKALKSIVINVVGNHAPPIYIAKIN